MSITDKRLTEIQALGPQGEQVAALIDRVGRLTASEAEKLDAAGNAAGNAARVAAWEVARVAAWVAAWDDTWVAARVAAGNAARVAVWDDTWDAAWVAARDAALALVVRDLISKEHYDLLTGPWAQVIGPAHPDDKESKQ